MPKGDNPRPQQSMGRVFFVSFIGTAIEFYDFYIYGTAAALIIGPTFFPPNAPLAQTINAFLTFGIAFLARPIGAALFGHFGDRDGRKKTLVASLLVMGLSTTLIGVLPGYAALGPLAPALLCLLRFGQGIGLGGEWGGAALLAAENAPTERRAWFAMSPQLGPAAGFLCATGSFLILTLFLNEGQFTEWGWRIPFLCSPLLLAVGLYARVELEETPVFARLQQSKIKRAPLHTLLRHHAKPMVLGGLSIVVCYALFYISTVFSLSYGTVDLHIPRSRFLGMQCVAILFMAAATPLSAWASDRFGRRPVLLVSGTAALLSGFAMAPLLGSGSPLLVTAFLAMELFIMGATFAPMGALLSELFPTEVRYTGAATSYNLGGILGASLAPYVAQRLAHGGGLSWVGGYVSAAAAISLIGVLAVPETIKSKL